MLADGWAMFGSSNMDWLSHAVNYEMDVATSDPDIAGRLKRDLFMADFRRARELRPVKKPEPIHRIASVDSRQWR
jgi:phosphatidylserine/phosphatidylglycerophosphate/cardiolipin synthase-like enzyme